MKEQMTALVTGASSGIGEAYCRALASRCKRIIAVARRDDRLQALVGDLAGQCEVIPVVADLATLEGVTRTVEAMRQRGPVHCLVNNAGFSTLGPLEHSDIEDELAMVRVHVDATVSLCRAAIPFMREAGGGYLINVASVGAFLEMRSTAVYGACKAFMVSLSRSLQEEVSSAAISVQCLCPGMTRTEIHDQPAFAGFDKSQIPEEMWMEVEPVVAASLEALDSGRVVVVPGELNRSLVRDGVRRLLDALD